MRFKGVLPNYLRFDLVSKYRIMIRFSGLEKSVCFDPSFHSLFKGFKTAPTICHGFVCDDNNIGFFSVNLKNNTLAKSHTG